MRRRRLQRRSQRKIPQLKMTSMMDILTVLLLFLLKSFVVEAEVITPAAGVQLPESTSRQDPPETVVIAINDEQVTVGDHVVAPVGIGNGDSLLIPALAAHLRTLQDQSRSLASRRGESAPIAGRITIQGDRDMPFQLLQRVMYTCNQSGYDDISLAVIQTS